MRDLLKRLERLEQVNPPGHDPVLTIVRFIVRREAGGELETVSARSSWVGGIHPTEWLEREPGESSAVFEERARLYFNRHRGAMQCAS